MAIGLLPPVSQRPSAASSAASSAGIAVSVLAASFLLLAGRAAAQPSDETPPARPPPLTAMAAGPLGRAGLVLLAELEDVRGLRGMVLARVKPIRTLKGDPPGEGPVTVLIRGPRPTCDPQAPSAPYLAEGMTGRYVFFLVQRTQGVAWRLDALFDVSGDVGQQKLATLEQHAALLAIPDPEERAHQTLTFLLEAQVTKGTWTRVHAARELNHLVGVRPDLFHAEVRNTLRRLVRRTAVPAQRTWLKRLLETLGGRAPDPAPPTPEDGDTDPLEEALAGVTDVAQRSRIYRGFLHERGSGGAETVLCRLGHEPGAVRIGVLTTLAEGGYRAQLDRIRGLYASEDDGDVLQAIVRAVGLLGGAGDVPWLVERLANPGVRREALFALARVRTPEALRALDETAEQLAGSEGATSDIPALVNYLRSEAFVEVEASAGRTVGPGRSR